MKASLASFSTTENRIGIAWMVFWFTAAVFCLYRIYSIEMEFQMIWNAL